MFTGVGRPAHRLRLGKEAQSASSRAVVTVHSELDIPQGQDLVEGDELDHVDCVAVGPVKVSWLRVDPRPSLTLLLSDIH